MRKRKREGAHSNVEIGFAIRSRKGGGYFECNGLGDTTLAGTSSSCEVFTTQKEAQQTINGQAEEWHGVDDEDVEIVPIVRCTAILVSDPVGGRL